MRPEPEMILVLIDATKALKGSQRRLFMAKTVQAMGRGGRPRGGTVAVVGKARTEAVTLTMPRGVIDD